MLTGFLSILLVAVCVFFMIDWKEFRAVMKLGGWATICIYLVLGVAIAYIIACPEAGGHVTHGGGHH